MKSMLFAVPAFLFLLNCSHPTTKSAEANKKPSITKISENRETQVSHNQKDIAEQWLRNIFKCDDGGFHCFYIDKEIKICTPRFYKFLMDSNEIFGSGNYTDVELGALENQYRKKWSVIYPLHTQEMWLFGRGNDDDLEVKIKKIEKIGNLRYAVDLVFGGEVETKNVVTLVRAGNSFKRDYCETQYL